MGRTQCLVGGLLSTRCAPFSQPVSATGNGAFFCPAFRDSLRSLFSRHLPNRSIDMERLDRRVCFFFPCHFDRRGPEVCGTPLLVKAVLVFPVHILTRAGFVS